MMEEVVKILSIEQLTHDVKRYRFEKPEGYHFEPGQATEVSINQEKWKEERRPFTFTSLNEWPFLEFTIKSYRDHDGVTHAFDGLRAGDELIIRDVWGAITYKGEGCFIAGGAGITPFLAILRQLYKDKKLAGNRLYFSNRTESDIILRDELTTMLGDNARFIITRSSAPGIVRGYINKDFLQKNVSDFSKPFYVCGPDKMVESIISDLRSLGASPEAIVFEQ